MDGNKIILKTSFDCPHSPKDEILAFWLSDNPEDNEDHIGEVSCVIDGGKPEIVDWLNFAQIQSLMEELKELGYEMVSYQNDAIVGFFAVNLPLLKKKGMVMKAGKGGNHFDEWAVVTFEYVGSNKETTIQVPVGKPFQAEALAADIGDLLHKKTRKLHIRVWCQAHYDGTISVPDNLTLEEAVKYAKDHIDDIKGCDGQLVYLPDSDEIDDEDANPSFKE